MTGARQTAEIRNAHDIFSEGKIAGYGTEESSKFSASQITNF